MMIIVLLLAMTTTQITQAEEPPYNNEKQPIIDADNTLYPIKIYLLTAITRGMTNEEARITRELTYANERRIEAQQATTTKGITRAIRASEEAITRAEEQNNELNDSPAQERIREQIVLATKKHIKVLEEVRERVPTTAQNAIDLAITESQKDVDRIAATLPVEAQERLNIRVGGRS